MLDFEFIRDNWLFIAIGIGVTLGVTISSFLLATPLAVIVAKGRRSTILPIKAIFSLYVVFIDGIPLLLQIFFVFLALPQLGIFIPGIWAVLLIMIVYYSVRMSDVYYSRYNSEGKSQGKPFFPGFHHLPMNTTT